MKTILLSSIVALAFAFSVQAASATQGDNNAEQNAEFRAVQSQTSAAPAGRSFYAVERTEVNDHSGNVVRQ